ncbi:hypothetical protein ACOMHN_045750 [Nucella lapillus]
MAQVLVERPVLFSGIWRPRHSLDDAFLRLVSRQFQDKRGAQASWRLTAEGLTIVAQRSGEGGRGGQTDQIPVQSIKEVTANRYNPLCLMALYVDPSQRFNALVCRCQTEQDAAHIVQVFRWLQKSLSGEGYRIDLKQPQGINWTLQTKENGEREGGEERHAGDLHQDHLNKNVNGEASINDTHPYHDSNSLGMRVVVVETEEESLEREPLEREGRPCFNVGVQADLAGADDDTVSITSEMSYQSLKDELETLSNEVRDIKILLEQTTGISAEEFFKRRRDPNFTALVPVMRPLSEELEGGKAGEKSVNFATLPGQGEGGEEDMDFDIRSVGMQTTETSSKPGRYLKRVRSALKPSRYQQPSYRSNSGSSSSSQSSPGPVSPFSPFSPNRPGDGSVFFNSAHGYSYADPRRDPRRDPRLASGSVSRASVYSSGGTVVRPIEAVYHVHTPAFRKKRRQVVVLPNRLASMPRQVRRLPSDSAAPSVDHKHQASRNPSTSAAENGTS